MTNALAICITISIIVHLLLQKKSLLDFRVFTLIYVLFFYQLSFYSYYFLEKKIDYSLIEEVGIINLIMILSYLVSEFTLKLPVFKKYKYKKTTTYNSTRIKNIEAYISIALLGLVAIYFARAGTFPIFLENLEAERIIIAHKVSGFVIVLLQFVFVLFVLKVGRAFNERKQFLAVVILMSAVSFWVLMASKRPIAGLFLMFLLFYHYQKKNISNFLISISVLIILILIAAYGSFRFYGNIQVIGALSILRAIFNADMYNLTLLINDPLPLQYGKTYLNSILMIFTDTKNFGDILKEHYGLVFKGGGITIGVVGEGLINFSYFGVFFESSFFWLLIIMYAKRIERMAIQGDYIKIAKYIFYFYFLIWILRNGFFASVTAWLYFIIFEIIDIFVRRKRNPVSQHLTVKHKIEPSPK